MSIASEGRYTISEIDRMRKAIRTKLTWLWVTDREESCKFPEQNRAHDTESLLRTHMMNGTSVDDLERDAQDSIEAKTRYLAQAQLDTSRKSA